MEDTERIATLEKQLLETQLAFANEHIAKLQAQFQLAMIGKGQIEEQLKKMSEPKPND